MMIVVHIARTLLFYLAFLCWSVLGPILVLLMVYWLPFKHRHRLLIKTWSQVTIYLCRVCCGIRWQVQGKEHIPDTPCVVISNHQSAWETFFIQTLFTPQTQVVKRELLAIPFFGWGLRAMQPIAINRQDRSTAMQQVSSQGKHCLEQGLWVLIFPEGTRQPHGKLGPFSKGGARLACATHTDILPIAHNAGAYWSNHTWIKKPGVIQVRIGKVIKTVGQTPEAVNQQARAWIHDTLQATEPSVDPDS